MSYARAFSQKDNWITEYSTTANFGLSPILEVWNKINNRRTNNRNMQYTRSVQGTQRTRSVQGTWRRKPRSRDHLAHVHWSECIVPSRISPVVELYFFFGHTAS